MGRFRLAAALGATLLALLLAPAVVRAGAGGRPNFVMPIADGDRQFVRQEYTPNETGSDQRDSKDFSGARERNEEAQRRKENYYANEHVQMVGSADEYKRELKRGNDRAHELSPMLGDAPGYIVYDGARRGVIEPTSAREVAQKERLSDIFQVSEDDFRIEVLNNWTLRAEDFKAQMPEPITIHDDFTGDRMYDVVLFTLTNSTNQDLLMSPLFYLVSGSRHDPDWDQAVFTPAVGGYFIRQQYRETLLRNDLVSDLDLAGYIRRGFDGLQRPTGRFKAGETKTGVIVFQRHPRDIDKMRLVVEGLSQTTKYDQRLRRVLVLDYKRPRGDQYGPFEPLQFEENRWAHWEWLWLWDQDLQIPENGQPIRVVELRPAAADSGLPARSFWIYLYTLTNSTGEPQRFKGVASFDTLIETELSGFDVDGVPCKVEVTFPDDGTQSFDVERAIRTTFTEPEERDVAQLPQEGKYELARWLKPFERFRHARTEDGWLKPGETLQGLVVFDDKQYDIASVYRQVEEWLNRMSPEQLYPPERAEDPSPPEAWQVRQFRYPPPPPRRKLTEKEKELIRNQLDSRIADTLRGPFAEQLRQKHILARVHVQAGLNSGAKLLHRHYIEKAKYNELSWIRWERGWWAEPRPSGPDVDHAASREPPRYEY